MRVDLFDFDFPTKLIAQQPAEPRESARLLHIGAKNRDLQIKDLPLLLAPGDVVVVNNTKVIPCRLRGHRPPARPRGHLGEDCHAAVPRPAPPAAPRRGQGASPVGWAAAAARCRAGVGPVVPG